MMLAGLCLTSLAACRQEVEMSTPSLKEGIQAPDFTAATTDGTELSLRSLRGKIVVLGNLLPLHANPLRVAEEYAMLDNMSDGRLIAGFAPGSGPETFNYDVPSATSREHRNMNWLKRSPLLNIPLK